MNKLKAIILCIMGIIIPACAQNDKIKSVYTLEFEKDIQDSTVQLLDVRTTGEFAEGHIVNAINIDVKSSNFKENILKRLDKKRVVYVYCRSGRRSMVAAEILAKEGFSVINLNGGIMDWIKNGKPVCKDQK